MPKSNPVTKAAIFDLGSNSVKFFLATQKGCTLTVHQEEATTTRLGASLALTNQLSSHSIKTTLQVLKNSMRKVKTFGVDQVLAVGTSALRSATNSHEVLIPAREILGTSLKLISGKLEGELVYAGATCLSHWIKKTVLVIDVGGGSVEFVIGCGGNVLKSISLPLGCVRMKDLFFDQQPPKPERMQQAQLHLETEFKNKILRHLPPNFTTLGTGGTMITLALMQRGDPHKHWTGKLEGTKLSQTHLRAHCDFLAHNSLSQIKKHPSIPPARADIITAGAVIYSSALQALNLPEIYCATHGLRYGLWAQKIAPQPLKRIIRNP